MKITFANLIALIIVYFLNDLTLCSRNNFSRGPAQLYNENSRSFMFAFLMLHLGMPWMN